MQALKLSFRIVRFLWKAILGLLLVLISAVAIVHIPPVQRQITRAVSNYLSSKIEAKVYIDRIEFSILGHISLKDMTIWNRDGIKIFSIEELEIKSGLFDLFTGSLIFDEMRIVGLNGKLIQEQSGLNIQFIIDAFQSDKPSSDTPSALIKLQFKNVQLEKIDFEYASSRDGIVVANVVGMLRIENAEFSTNPNLITADKVYLKKALTNILLTQGSDTTSVIIPSKIDSIFTGSGFVIKVKDLKVEDSNFTLHQNEIIQTPKFDPSHIEINDIYVGLSDILVGIRKDTVSAILHSLTAKMPGVKVNDARTSAQWSRRQLAASGFHITTERSEINAEFIGGYKNNAIGNIEHAHIDVNTSGRVNPKELSYFLSDSVTKHFSHWQTTDVALEGHYNQGRGAVKTLRLQAGNSRLQASTTMGDLFNIDKVYWNNLSVNASMGSDFRETLVPLLPNITLPTTASIQLRSAGTSANASIVGKLSTNAGDVEINGQAGLQENSVGINMSLTGEQVDVGGWIQVPQIGPATFSLQANGIIGDSTNVEVDGTVSTIEVMDQNIRDITLQSQIENENAAVNLKVADPNYRSTIQSNILFAGPLVFTSNATLDNFKIDDFLSIDSTLLISGNLNSKITIDESSTQSFVEGDSILLQNQSLKYSLDTVTFHLALSPTGSDFEYHSDNEHGKLTANFDLRNSLEVIQARLNNILKGNHSSDVSTGNKTLQFDIKIENAKLFQLLNIDVENFSSLHIKGDLDEQQRKSILQATSGKINAYGISLDTLNANMIVLRENQNLSINATNLIYNSVAVGTLDLEMIADQDTVFTNLLLFNDTTDLLGLHTRILLTDSGAHIYPDELFVLDRDYSIDFTNPIFINNEKNVSVNHLQINRKNMHIDLDGDLNSFNMSLQNVDLTPLNFLFSTDTTIINEGHLNGNISYSPRARHINIKANIDTLRLYNSDPLTIAATAVSNGNKVPFEFLVTNSTNTVDLKGEFDLHSEEVDATLALNINNPETFQFLVAGVVDEMHGTIRGNTKITGPIQKPIFKGHVQLLNAELTTVNPKFNFNVQDDSIILDNSSLVFNSFTIYDQEHHPLTVDGKVNTKDYQSVNYDLRLRADDYTLMNKPDSASGHLSGKLVLDTDVKLKGNERDTNVEAKITIKDNTSLMFVSSNDDIELLTAEGIVDFVDPTVALDSALDQSVSFYDSLIASLPEFSLNSTVRIEDDAKLRIVIDAQSGDYMETSGGAALDLSYDRTGTLKLIGDYRIKKGVYRVSFYDLVKRNFALVPNSSIHWSGSPEDGALNIKAVHTVASNSIGLIGHEIGENEKAIYKRSLDYEVGININGTIDKPIVSFSLDLPQQEKTSYPVLANKLERLKQPEFQSELNKQVFGLLVLGGFLPETSGSDINSSQIATTALSNSVNSLLAGQLNRFASQYIKGVNIDVGIQSYADYSAPGGKTQTAMDFRVSKRIMDDRLSFEIGGDFDINTDQSGVNKGTKNYRGDVAIVYDLTGNADKQLKLFNNETYDIVYQEIRNTGISIIFIREFSSEDKKKRKEK